MEELKWFAVDFFQAVTAGLLVGGTYGLMCVGLGIIFGVMRVVNFAQGDFMMLGMYATYYLVTGFGVLRTPARLSERRSQDRSFSRSAGCSTAICWRALPVLALSQRKLKVTTPRSS